MQFKFRNSEINFNSIKAVKDGFSFNFEFFFADDAKGKTNSNKITDKLINDIAQIGEITGHGSDNLVSLGTRNKFNLAGWLLVARKVAQFILPKKINRISLAFTDEIFDQLNLKSSVAIEKFLVDFVNEFYYFDDFKSKKVVLSLEHIDIVSKVKLDETFAAVVANLEGLFLVRDLGNNPANVATPEYLANTAKSFTALNKHVSAEIFNEKEIKKLGMNAFLGVAQGAEEKPYFIKLEYNAGKKHDKPIVLVGKGITFDSGGISIKPSQKMDEMKFDMGGAAAVLGVFVSAVKLKLPINLMVLVPTCENLPSGKAIRPGDIVTTMSGKTVEVLNTDAEGRLILCDALYYAQQFKPELVIDVATLTGACVVALGSVASGLYVNDENLYSEILKASQETDEKVWRMPLFDEYTQSLKGDYADLMNISWGGKGGSPTAACFLQEFTDYKWAHLDIAGVANSAEAKGGTGRPFKLLIEFLRNLSA